MESHVLRANDMHSSLEEKGVGVVRRIRRRAAARPNGVGVCVVYWVARVVEDVALSLHKALR